MVYVRVNSEVLAMLVLQGGAEVEAVLAAAVIQPFDVAADLAERRRTLVMGMSVVSR